MGKMLSLLIGAIVAVVGLILFIAWWTEFTLILRGLVPIMLLFGGVIAVIAGFTELKDSLKKEEKK